MNKLLSVIVGAVLVPVVTFSGVGATTAVGQIEGGNIYKAKNVTKGGVFEDPTNATCNELVKLRVEIHNPGPVKGCSYCSYSNCYFSQFSGNC